MNSFIKMWFCMKITKVFFFFNFRFHLKLSQQSNILLFCISSFDGIEMKWNNRRKLFPYNFFLFHLFIIFCFFFFIFHCDAIKASYDRCASFVFLLAIFRCWCLIQISEKSNLVILATVFQLSVHLFWFLLATFVFELCVGCLSVVL